MVIKHVLKYINSILDKTYKNLLKLLSNDINHNLQISVYDKLNMELDRLSHYEINLNVDPTGLGNISAYSNNIVDLNRILIRINEYLKGNQHIKKGIINRDIKEVSIDSFIYVNGNYYIDNPEEVLHTLIQHIQMYCNLMYGSDTETFGVREHNHRELYPFTLNLIDFIKTILDRFVK